MRNMRNMRNEVKRGRVLIIRVPPQKMDNAHNGEKCQQAVIGLVSVENNPPYLQGSLKRKRLFLRILSFLSILNKRI